MWIPSFEISDIFISLDFILKVRFIFSYFGFQHSGFKFAAHDN
jgi:hypothetical protein